MYLYDIDAKQYRCEGGDGITKNKKDYLKNNIRSKSKLTTKKYMIIARRILTTTDNTSKAIDKGRSINNKYNYESEFILKKRVYFYERNIIRRFLQTNID